MRCLRVSPWISGFEPSILVVGNCQTRRELLHYTQDWVWLRATARLRCSVRNRNGQGLADCSMDVSCHRIAQVPTSDRHGQQQNGNVSQHAISSKRPLPHQRFSPRPRLHPIVCPRMTTGIDPASGQARERPLPEGMPRRGRNGDAIAGRGALSNAKNAAEAKVRNADLDYEPMQCPVGQGPTIFGQSPRMR